MIEINRAVLVYQDKDGHIVYSPFKNLQVESNMFWDTKPCISVRGEIDGFIPYNCIPIDIPEQDILNILEENKCLNR